MSDSDDPAAAGAAVEAAFGTSGFRAAVFKPMFGQAFQQYFTARWLCEAMLPIAEHAFGFHTMLPEQRPRLNVIDPTAGSGRLLAPFKAAGHNVLGVELDARLAETTAKALGRRSVRQGDIMAYGSLIPPGRWQVAVTNAPFGLHWPIPAGSPYEDYELRSGESIESQHMVLELVTNLLAYQNGLLLGIFSGKFFDTYPRAAAFLNKHYQIITHLLLPKPFKAEYGIDVDAAFVVAVTDSPYSTKKPPVLTGPFDAVEDCGPALVGAVNAAFDRLKRSPYYRPAYASGPGNQAVFYLHAPFAQAAPHVPDLDDVVEVDTASLPLRLTARGVAMQSDWSAAWFKLYSSLPVQAYDTAQGTYAPLGEAYGSLPNILMTGVDENRARLADLGFDVSLTDHDLEQIGRRARRFARDRLPIRELEPMEFLSRYPDGPITARNTATLPGGTVIPADATYDLRGRWFRREKEVGTGEEKGEGKKHYTQHTFVDRGYLVLRFAPAAAEHDGIELKPFVVEEINPDAIKALVEAFGLPEVPTVEDLPELAGWETRLARFMDAHQAAAGGKRLYPVQAADVARMATKRAVALLYEMGAGKTTTMAHWATVRGYHSALIVTPASVVPGILEDLQAWGFPARRLDHAAVTRLHDERRRHRLARQQVRTARQREPKLRERLAALLRLQNGEMVAASRQWGLPEDGPVTLYALDRLVKEKAQAFEARLQHEKEILARDEFRARKEAELARKRRHLRCLLAIQRKDKSDDPEQLDLEIADTRREIDELARLVAEVYAGQDDTSGRDPCQLLPDFWVTSYQDLSLGDHLGIFDPWDHDHFDREGNYLGTVRGNRSAKCTCDTGRKGVVAHCPKCGAPWRGQGEGGGRFCRQCGHRAWTMGRAAKRPLPEVERSTSRVEQIQARRRRLDVVKEHHLAARAGGQVAEDIFLSTYHQWPLGNRIKNLFGCVMLDEAQDSKSKLSLRGAASRGLRANGKALLTGTWIKGYVTDVFWSAGWLLGFGSPLWPFPYRGGSARFLGQFGTYEYVTKEFANSLEVGKRKLIPSVSNLNRLWKLLSPVSIRRLKADFLVELPEKHRHVHWVGPTGKHELLVGHVTDAMKDVLQRELRKADPNMGAISAALWWGRYVASCPNEYGALHFAGAWGHHVNVDDISPAEARAILDAMRLEGAYLVPAHGPVACDFNKVTKTLELVEAIKAAGEKVIVFTSLRGLYRTLEVAFRDHCIAFVGMDGVDTKKRNDVVRRFEASSTTVLLAGTGTLNRGVTVNGANHVIILNLEWSPETTLQAEDRCHRPGQTREVHVHYILSGMTVDEQMHDLVMQKWAAQRAVQDRETQHKSVEAILEEAALANVQLAVARAVLADLKLPPDATAEQKAAAAQQAREAIRDITDRLVFGSLPPELRQAKRKRPAAPQVAVYVGTLFEPSMNSGSSPAAGTASPPPAPAGQVVQLAFF